MPEPIDFRFEPAPELPGSDRLSKYLFGGIRQAAHRLWDLNVEGRENVPTDGPALIAPNHLSFCDSIFVPAALPRRIWAIGKAEYMDSWKTKHLFPALGMVPVKRSSGSSAKAALDTAARVLDDGRLFLIYPEGTRSRSGNLHKGRTGVARLSIRCNAPVVPVGHEGTLDIQPPDTVLLKPRRPVTVRLGRPMWPSEFGDPDDPRTLRVFTDAVMFEISQLSGQNYVDRYASRDDKPANGIEPKAAASSNAASTRDDRVRITPNQPSLVGETESTVSRPPNRPSGDNTASSPSVSGTAEAIEAISRPPGRRTPAV